VFSAVSGIGFALIVVGLRVRASPVPLFAPWPTAIAIAPAAMAVALVLIAAGNLRGHLRRMVKHPMLIGTLIWSGVHLMANGDVASTLLFGAFLAWAAIDLVSAIARHAVKTFTPRLAHDGIAIVGGIAPRSHSRPAPHPLRRACRAVRAVNDARDTGAAPDDVPIPPRLRPASSRLRHYVSPAVDIARHPLPFIGEVLREFRRNHGLLLAGAVAYYMLLSIVPLLILLVAALSHILDPAALMATLGRYLDLIVPGQTQPVVQDLASFVRQGVAVSGIILLVLLFFSSLAFGVLENTFAVIFHHRRSERHRSWVTSALIPTRSSSSWGSGWSSSRSCRARCRRWPRTKCACSARCEASARCRCGASTRSASSARSCSSRRSTS
jgi:hypothetical protein